MLLVIALVAAVSAVAMSQVVISSVSARGQSTVLVAVGETDAALEWDVEVEGGTPSADHVALVPVAVGSQAEFTVAVDRATAGVRLTLVPGDRELTSVRCLDDLWPPTEINAVIDGPSFTVEIVPGRRYRCFAVSSPIGVGGQAGASATPATANPVLPRTDASATWPSALSAGWLTVVMTLVVIAGIAFFLRPARR